MTDDIRPVEIEPNKIEAESFRIIAEEIAAMGRSVPERFAPIIKRVIHTTADFSYLDTMYFSEEVLEKAEAALLGGTDIVTDTNMARSGIHRTTLERMGGRIHCFMADEDVSIRAKELGQTRAAVSMEKSSELSQSLIYVIGNAPTALFRLVELSREQRISPAFVIGAPVGFVNVVEAKELLIASGIPCIVTRGRKGGSNVAAAIVNALLYMITGRD